MNEPHSCVRIGFNQQVNRAIAAINGDINCEPSGDTNVRFLELNLAGSSDRFWPGAPYGQGPGNDPNPSLPALRGRRPEPLESRRAAAPAISRR